MKILETPSIFYENNFLEEGLNYVWNTDIEKKIFESSNAKVIQHIEKLNFKAIFGFGIAASEWIFWRLKKWRELEEGKNIEKLLIITQAHWFGLLDKYYMTPWDFTASHNESHKIETPLWYFMSQFVFIRNHFTKARKQIYREVSNIILIARHISPDQKFFDDWFTHTLKKAVELFPATLTSNSQEDRLSYDVNNELFIPREFFFEPTFDYETADLEALKCYLLESNSYKENKFLASPESMIEKGFLGVPYQS